MAQPTTGSVHVDALLTNLSVAYIQKQENFLATKVAPIVPVDRQSDKYAIYTKNDWFRDEAKLRTGSQESVGSGYNISTTTYFADVYSIHKDIDKHTRLNADPVFNLENDAVEFVTQRLLLRREIDWVSTFFTTSVWGTDSTPANLWSNYATSDPITDIETGKSTILSNTGFEPNTLVFGYDTFRYLKNHPDIIDRIKYTSSETVTPQMLARIFELDNVRVAKAVKATNAENETGVYAFTHGKHALLCYVAPNPGLLVPSAMYTFAWRGVSGGLGESVAISRFDLPERNGTIRVEGDIAFDHKVIGSDLGYFFNSAVA